MYEYDMVAQETQHHINESMETIMEGLDYDWLGRVSKYKVKKMTNSCESILAYYKQFPHEADKDKDTQFAKMLLEQIRTDCPEHLI